MDDEKTVVVFRKWAGREQKEGDVIALFPEIPADNRGVFCSSYEHVGQHGGASYCLVMTNTTPARPEEYVGLKRELESEPYNYRLGVRVRCSPQMIRRRKMTAKEGRSNALRR